MVFFCFLVLCVCVRGCSRHSLVCFVVFFVVFFCFVFWCVFLGVGWGGGGGGATLYNYMVLLRQ